MWDNKRENLELRKKTRKFATLITNLRAIITMKKITHNAPLLAYNTFGMDVKAAILAEYETLTELQELLADEEICRLMQAKREQGELPFWHIGAGSNLLFKGDYAGVVLHCTGKGISVVENLRDMKNADDADLRRFSFIEVVAGTTWDDVCEWCADHELYGAENLSLIPGEAGAGAVQNIGAYGVEIKDLIKEVVCWDVIEKCEKRLSREEMQYGYRASLLKQPEAKSRYIVTSVILQLSKEPVLHLEYAGLKQALADVATPTLKDVRKAVIAIRQGKLPDPKELGNAGSFFKNPVVEKSVYERVLNEWRMGSQRMEAHGEEATIPHYVVTDELIKIPAGWLIEQCGWKGKSIGRAGVYEKQCLVLVNRGGATPQEIVNLCQQVVASVKEKFDIDIEPEVNLI